MHTLFKTRQEMNRLLPMAAAIGALFTVTGAQASIATVGNVEPTDPSTWTSSTIAYVGHTSNGALTIDGQSSLTSNYLRAGYNPNVTGIVNVSGSGTNYTFRLGYIGYSGTSVLNITNGATAGKSGNGTFTLGNDTGSSGTVNVDGPGSQWNETGGYIGASGTGVLRITNGGTSNMTSTAWIGYRTNSVGIVNVDGAGSKWTNTSNTIVGNDAVPSSNFKGTAYLSITDGGAVSAGVMSVNSFSTLTTDLGYGSLLNVGTSGTGTLTNNGTIRLVAGADAVNGTYTPMAYGSMTGTGTVQTLGGIWDATAHTVTVSDAATASAGETKTLDLSTTQRLLVTDAATGDSVGMGFKGASTPTSISFSASEASGAEQSALQSLLAPGQSVLSAWDFTPGAGYNSGDPVYLSLFAGAGHSLSDLAIWHFDGSLWSLFSASDLAYDNQFASFTATGFSGYAVTGFAAPVPVPAAVWLLGSALAGFGVFGWRKPA